MDFSIFVPYPAKNSQNIFARLKRSSTIQTLDKKDFETLFRSFYPSLCTFSVKIVTDMDTAKDIVHNVFVNLWEKREQLDASTSFKSYLFTAVHNRSLNHIRDQKKFDKTEFVPETNEAINYESADLLETTELQKKINNAIDSLPEKCREIFLLNRFEELKYQEIADKLNISIKTVETQMSKALKTLREKLWQHLVQFIFWIILFFT